MNSHPASKKWIAPLTAAALVALAACGGAPADQPSTSVVVALAKEPASLDPCDTSAEDNGRVISYNIAQALTAIDPVTAEVTPLLATSWTRVDDLTWRFTLADGVTFHDGQAFDATAAATVINRAMQPELECQSLGLFAIGLEASAVDPHTLQIVTEQPDPILPRRLTYLDLPSPATPLDEKANVPIGTGPYKWVSGGGGADIVLTAYDGYWGDAPAVKDVRFVWRADDSVRAAMTRAGEADLALPVATRDAVGDPNSRSYPNNEVFLLRLRTDLPPFTDVRVRQAVGLAVDKQTLISSLLPDTATVADQLVSEFVNGYVDDYRPPAFDPERARALLAEARADGVPVDTEILLVERLDLFPGSAEVSQAIQQMLQNAGFTVKLVQLEKAAWNEYQRPPFPAGQQVNIFETAHDNLAGDAALSWPNYFTSTGRLSTVNDPEVDALVAQGAQADEPQRSALFQQAARLVYERVHAIVPVAQMKSLLLLSDRVDYEPNGLTNAELRLSELSLR